MRIRVTVVQQNAVNPAGFAEASEKGWKAVGEHWRRHILPRHFTAQGARDYRYRRRTKRYEAYKMVTVGHRRPLEYSGRLKRTLMASATVHVNTSRPTRPKAKVKLNGPNYLKGRSAKAKELKRISRRDAEEMAKVLDRVITAELSKTTPPRRSRVR